MYLDSTALWRFTIGSKVSVAFRYMIYCTSFWTWFKLDCMYTMWDVDPGTCPTWLNRVVRCKEGEGKRVYTVLQQPRNVNYIGLFLCTHPQLTLLQLPMQPADRVIIGQRKCNYRKYSCPETEKTKLQVWAVDTNLLHLCLTTFCSGTECWLVNCQVWYCSSVVILWAGPWERVSVAGYANLYHKNEHTSFYTLNPLMNDPIDYMMVPSVRNIQ